MKKNDSLSRKLDIANNTLSKWGNISNPFLSKVQPLLGGVYTNTIPPLTESLYSNKISIINDIYENINHINVLESSLNIIQQNLYDTNFIDWIKPVIIELNKNIYDITDVEIESSINQFTENIPNCKEILREYEEIAKAECLDKNFKMVINQAHKDFFWRVIYPLILMLIPMLSTENEDIVYNVINNIIINVNSLEELIDINYLQEFIDHYINQSK